MIDPRGRVMKLTLHGIVTGSLIEPLTAMDWPDYMKFAEELEKAAEERRAGRIIGALWPLGRALRMLGFTVEEP